MSEFTELGLAPKITSAVEALGFTTPTPIQKSAIPLVLEGRDITGLAQTGTGKTAAFGLPLVQLLSEVSRKPEPKTVRALVLAPTRELVNQIADNLRTYVKDTKLSVRQVVGGASINLQVKKLGRGCDILVATPGRLIDLADRNAVRLDTVQHLVLDEADQMLDLGFIHSLRQIARLLGVPRQTLLFSATMPKQIAELSATYQNDPVRIEVSPPGRAADKVMQSVHFVGQNQKLEKLHNLLNERPDDLSLVFARTKHGAEKLMKQLAERGFSAASVHGNKSQPQREKAIRAFRNGDIRILVATDVAARGIDIPGVSAVYNFDLPEVAENYVHRIGRTARAGADGQAIAFCAPAELELLRSVEKLMKLDIPVASGDVPDARLAREEAKARRQRQGSRRHGSPHAKPGGRSQSGNKNRSERDARSAAVSKSRSDKANRSKRRSQKRRARA